jgi:hypothetical protein
MVSLERTADGTQRLNTAYSTGAVTPNQSADAIE